MAACYHTRPLISNFLVFECEGICLAIGRFRLAQKVLHLQLQSFWTLSSIIIMEFSAQPDSGTNFLKLIKLQERSSFFWVECFLYKPCYLKRYSLIKKYFWICWKISLIKYPTYTFQLVSIPTFLHWCLFRSLWLSFLWVFLWPPKTCLQRFPSGIIKKLSRGLIIQFDILCYDTYNQ